MRSFKAVPWVTSPHEEAISAEPGPLWFYPGASCLCHALGHTDLSTIPSSCVFLERKAQDGT